MITIRSELLYCNVSKTINKDIDVLMTKLKLTKRLTKTTKWKQNQIFNNILKHDFKKLKNTKFNRCHFDQNVNENYFLEAKIMLQKAKPQPKH